MAARDRCGPAWRTPSMKRCARDGLDAALDAGAAILAAGGDGASTPSRRRSASLEENPCFNAGRGSVLTASGHVELDAAIMDGRTRRAGAVAGLRTTRAPVSLARAADGARPARLPVGRRRRPISRATPASSKSTTTGSMFPERRRQLDELTGRAAASTTRSNMARSAPSLSTPTAMSPPRPRPAG